MAEQLIGSERMGKLGRTFRESAKLFGVRRKMWIPFLVVAAFEVVMLLAVFIAPHEPFSGVLAPPLRFFFTDRVLHYPAHLWFLYHVMKHTHLLAMLIAGAYMAGLACLMVQQAERGEQVSLYDALKSKRARYGRLLLIWVISWGLARLAVEFLPRLLAEVRWAGVIILLIMLLFQALFIYAIPLSVYRSQSWWRALLQSMALALRRPLSTALIVLIPSIPLIFVGFFMSSESMGKVVFLTIPELVYIFIVFRLVVWTVADAFMTVAAAHMCLTAASGNATQP